MRRPAPVPDLAWDAARARAFGGRALDLWAELLDRLDDLPVAPALTAADVRRLAARDVPDEPLGDDELFAYLRTLALEAATYPGHPGFMAYVSGAGTVPGAPAELLAAGLNMNAGWWRAAPAATEVEQALIAFLCAAFGLPDGAGGLLVSGGAIATFVALKAARDAALGHQVREDGVRGAPPAAIYASAEAHVVVDRAADLLGLGSAAVRRVGVDEGYRLRIDELRAALERDASAGVRPLAIVASAGTTATGAIDPLPELAELAAAHGAWLHVDAAYGGAAVLADELRPLLAGVELADSIALDPHKWLYVPLSVGCVLVRDERALARSFAVEASYAHQDLERTGRGTDLSLLGPQFSRGFAALKVWVSLLAHGRRAYGRRIAHDAELARYLQELVEAHPELELALPAALSICCFRFVPAGLGLAGGERDAYLDRLNERLMTDLQLDGRVYCSNAVLHGRFFLRACIVNFRTEAEHVEQLVEVVLELGRRLDADGAS